MLKSALTLTLLLFGANALALSDQCVDEATQAIVAYLEQDEAQANLEIVRDEKTGDILGLIDKGEVYGEFDLTDVVDDETGSIVIFHQYSYIVFAKVTETKTDGKISCRVDDVDSGQDDQD